MAKADVHKQGINRWHGCCDAVGRAIETYAMRGQVRGRRELRTAFRVVAKRYPHVVEDTTALEVPGMISANFPKA